MRHYCTSSCSMPMSLTQDVFVVWLGWPWVTQFILTCSLRPSRFLWMALQNVHKAWKRTGRTQSGSPPAGPPQAHTSPRPQLRKRIIQNAWAASKVNLLNRSPYFQYSSTPSNTPLASQWPLWRVKGGKLQLAPLHPWHACAQPPYSLSPPVPRIQPWAGGGRGANHMLALSLASSGKEHTAAAPPLSGKNKKACRGWESESRDVCAVLTLVHTTVTYTSEHSNFDPIAWQKTLFWCWRFL